MWGIIVNIVNKIIGKPKNMEGIIIDVSHNNGLIDWGKVKASTPKIIGAMLKASEGATNTDKKFQINVDGCDKNGIDWGAYHFATWNLKPVERDAKQEALHFINVVKSVGKKPTLPLVLDIESNKPIPYTKKEMVSYVKTFTDEIINAGYDVAIYGPPGFLNSYLPNDHPFTNIKLWVADYTGAINPVPGWKKIWLHQYTEQGKVNGIATNVDMNKIIQNTSTT